MSMEECFAVMPGKRLAAIGFLSDDGQMSYRRSLDCDFLHTECTRGLLAKRDLTTADRVRLITALWADIHDLKCQLPWANCLAIATPGLEMLAKEEIAATGLEMFSQIDLLVRYCLEQNYSYIGLLGTEWDVSLDSPLIQALHQNHIQTFVPKAEHRASVSVCATGALRSLIQFQGRVLDASDFCTEAVGWMIHEACGLMQALVICNPELTQLIPVLRSRRRNFFASRPIVNLPALYLNECIQKVSQP